MCESIQVYLHGSKYFPLNHSVYYFLCRNIDKNTPQTDRRMTRKNLADIVLLSVYHSGERNEMERMKYQNKTHNKQNWL